MQNKKSTYIAVVGADSQIGESLIPCLECNGYIPLRISRKSSLVGHEPTYVFDEANSVFVPFVQESVDVIISLAPLPAIVTILKMANVLGVKRIVAFGSAGIFSKADSTSELEQNFVSQQKDAENRFSSECEQRGIAWTLLRPTMVYGANRDLNISFIQKIIKRIHFFPIPFGAKGLRQPVHIDDLANACVTILDNKNTFNNAYNLGGGEEIAFDELVKRIFLVEKKRPIIVPVPLALIMFFIKIVKYVPGCSFVREEMVKRMFQDLIVNNEPAFVDFGYRARKFTP